MPEAMETCIERNADRLKSQIGFLMEIDKLKNVFRKSRILGGSRYENDAEHSWHLTVMAGVLLEHANVPGIDLLKVLKMLMIHDLVEIDAGDTFAYDDTGHLDKEERETRAAERIFGLLPEEQGRELFGLWREFEDRETEEARYASAMDRLHPMLLNFRNEGQSWRENGIGSERVLARNKTIAEGSETLWAYAEDMIGEARKRGYFP